MTNVTFCRTAAFASSRQALVRTRHRYHQKGPTTDATTPAPATGKGKADWFIGDVHVDMIVDHSDARFSVGSVHFAPGSRNAWHSHAAGQMLHCTDGVGLVVTDDDVMVLRPGVTVWTPPNQRHWHGAAPDRQMTHLAMSGVVELAEGEPAATWGEHISEADYLAAARAITENKG